MTQFQDKSYELIFIAHVCGQVIIDHIHIYYYSVTSVATVVIIGIKEKLMQ